MKQPPFTTSQVHLIGESSAPVVTSILDENVPINYSNTSKETYLSQTIPDYDFDIFISHASKVDDETNQSGVKVLPGELQFVNELISQLCQHPYDYKIYVDFENNVNIDYLKFIKSLKASKYGVFVCSPRWSARYLSSSSPIGEEVKYFAGLKYQGKRKEIPIIFGISIEDFHRDTPYMSVDYRIDAHYDDIVAGGDKANIRIKDIVQKIDNFIKNDKRQNKSDKSL